VAAARKKAVHKAVVATAGTAGTGSVYEADRLHDANNSPHRFARLLAEPCHREGFLGFALVVLAGQTDEDIRMGTVRADADFLAQNLRSAGAYAGVDVDIDVWKKSRGFLGTTHFLLTVYESCQQPELADNLEGSGLYHMEEIGCLPNRNSLHFDFSQG